MIMKNYLAASRILLLTLFLGLFASCSSDDKDDNGGGKEVETISFMKKYLYKQDGTVSATKLDNYQEGEYLMIAKDNQGAATFFTQLTGMPVFLATSYESQYQFKNMAGKDCEISIKGKKVPVNGIYATIYFNVPDCKEIKIIHIGTPGALDGTNGETTTVEVPSEIIVPVKV